jgi:hypothetical protein
MEGATKLANYLLLSFKTKSEQGYIAFLWSVAAFSQNARPESLGIRS